MHHLLSTSPNPPPSLHLLCSQTIWLRCRQISPPSFSPHFVDPPHTLVSSSTPLIFTALRPPLCAIFTQCSPSSSTAELQPYSANLTLPNPISHGIVAMTDHNMTNSPPPDPPPPTPKPQRRPQSNSLIPMSYSIGPSRVAKKTFNDEACAVMDKTSSFKGEPGHDQSACHLSLATRKQRTSLPRTKAIHLKSCGQSDPLLIDLPDQNWNIENMNNNRDVNSVIKDVEDINELLEKHKSKGEPCQHHLENPHAPSDPEPAEDKSCTLVFTRFQALANMEEEAQRFQDQNSTKKNPRPKERWMPPKISKWKAPLWNFKEK
ncbi:hypothetical protein Salat_1889200 [Sesamum alatum]|uniref:Uncharacterized protein n=1 Tax=Sesamum alatum TaxID=300844 RepID=A0AAE2CI52_9LAMI|nr:hypothetical protein Salat_1889200 [Sesamum alatum]